MFLSDFVLIVVQLKPKDDMSPVSLSKSPTAA